MYGQKQILQCLAIAIILAVFNFHRTVIKRNREVTKPKIIRKIKPNSRANEIDDESITVLNGNYSGYCIRYPFGKNVYANYDSDFMCGHICFDKLDTWLQKQCQANCCTKKTISINLPVRNIKKSATNGQLKTRNAENVLVNCYGGNGASLNNISQCEPEKTIIEPIIEILMNMEQNNPGEQEYECKIQTNIDQFICRNTTSATVDFVKLETINKTKTIMEYHDFLFNMAVPPETKTGSTQSIDRKNYSFFYYEQMQKTEINRFFFTYFVRNVSETTILPLNSFNNSLVFRLLGSMSSIFLAFTSLLVAFFIIRVIYKLFMTDHVS